MTTAEYALLVSILSLVVSLTALTRDRYALIARASFYEVESGKLAVSICVANSGKRSITISHVFVNFPNKERHGRNFHDETAVRIEVGDSIVTNIEPGDPLYLWSSLSELQTCKFYVHDALGITHRVKT